jgi:hypothetical protein
MMRKFNYLAAGLALVSMPVLAIDVSFYGLLKSQSYFQAPGSAPAGVSSNGFAFNAFVIGTGPDSVLGATVRLPSGGPIKTLEPEVEGVIYRLEETFHTSQALDSAYPNGTLLSGYTFTIQTAQDGPKTSTLRFLGLSYPPIPEIANLVEAQAVDTRLDFTLHWKSLGGNSLIPEIVQVFVYGSNFVYSSPAPFEEGALDGNSTSLLIPAGTLPPGAVLKARLGIVRPGLPNLNYGTGIPGLARETAFEIVTLSFSEPPRLELERSSSDRLRIRVLGEAGRRYELQASSDLENWSTVLITNSISAFFEWSDPRGSEFPTRFFRAQTDP